MAQEPGRTLVLRPGVTWPMWSHVTDPMARRALEASLGASHWLEKWAGLTASEDRVWQAMLTGFAHTGQTQDIPSLCAVADLETAIVVASLRAMRRRDMLVLDESTMCVSAAYPFCAWQTEHRLSIAGGATVYSLCAIDALGAGAMLSRDTVVDSACRLCEAPLQIATRDGGKALDSVSSSSAMVWSGVHYADNCSATSGCALKAFFCSDAHLTAWRERADRERVGFALSLEAALQIGRALFCPMLMRERAESGLTVFWSH